ncbi:TadE/TadG family type IV pilus assembly protein [Paenibacillus humicola]|uniref:TadE/TadG family type IV pilus assembly protein n=1 Tax=Paenibacillus humicola TaxID=3110540 RepID=UPI00237BEFAC|nr:TadE family protein [Paenibacillus humicola]
MKFSARFHKLLKRLPLRSEEGGFAVEASLVLPVVFGTLLAMILFSMYVYQQVIVYSAASITAERAAFRWDNSYREKMNGMGITGKYDGLYWRMSGNGALQSLFQTGGGENSGETAIDFGGAAPAGEDGASGLPVLKMEKAVSRVPDSYEGRIRYSFGLLQKKISVTLREPMSVPALNKLLGRSEPEAEAGAVIVDPVEFIRDIDLVRYYTAKFKEGPDAGKQREQASEVLESRKALESKPSS